MLALEILSQIQQMSTNTCFIWPYADYRQIVRGLFKFIEEIYG
jgi:hypothetical protein